MKDAADTRDGALGPGARLGRYEVLGLLARGAMGSVYLGRTVGAGGFSRLVALKVMHPHLADEAEFVHMLVDEARVASRIHHPNVVATLDLAEHQGGYHLVMDYVDGVTLSAVRTTQALAPEQRLRAALRILVDALTGLHAAHELCDEEGRSLRVVHRDVSPHNILVGVDGVGRIMDFGIALAAARVASSRPGMLKGKPQYMAPEQVLGTPVDRRADVFAAGIVLWEFLTGERLFRGDTEAASLMMVCNAPIALPSSVSSSPACFDDVTMRALARDPAERFPTARAMLDALVDAITRAGLAMSSHDLAELVRDAFADDLAKRRALARTRPTEAPREEPPAHSDSLLHGDTVASTPARPLVDERPKETSTSIPAIEVTPARKPSEQTTVRISVTEPAPRKPARVVVAVASAVCALVVGVAWWATRPPAQSPVAAASPRMGAPTPAPAPPPTSAPAPVLEVPAALTPTPAPSPPPTPAAAPVAEAPAPLAAPPSAHPRAAARRPRHGADASVAPPLESNPYLRR